MKKRFMSSGPWVGLLLLVFAAAASAQVETATMFGSVSDKSGAVIPGAQVTAKNVETGFSRSATTNDRGEYSIKFLPVGTYRVEARAKGFHTFAQNGAVLDVQRNARVDAVLEVGSVTETVTVTSDVLQVNTFDPSLGRTVENSEIINSPLVNRNVYSLLTLTPGVELSESVNPLGSPGQRTLINGSPDAGTGSVNYYLDGGTNMSGLRNLGNAVPNPDAVQEFRVITNGYSAEFGRFAGGVVDVITKSGTNTLHGSLFEFLRNDKLNTSPWNVPEKPPLRRNQFGGSFGGAHPQRPHLLFRELLRLAPGLFIQDDFRIHPRLTLNLGLRYDLQLPMTDPQNRKLTYVAGRQSVVVPTAPVGLLFPGDPEISRGIIPARTKNFAPRVGLAWDPFGNGKTSVRAAFGIYYGNISANEWNQTADRQPFSVRQRLNNATLSDPYNGQPGGRSPFPYTYQPSNPRFLRSAEVGGPSLDYQWPYTYQLNFSVQRQLTSTISLTGAYLGTLARISHEG